MSLSTILGIAVFFAGYILSQKLGLNARAKLDDTTKLKIIDVFAKRNVNYSTIVFALIVVYFASLYAFPQHNTFLLIVYAAIFLIYMFAKLILNVKKLREIAAPPEYIKSIIMSFGVFIGGAIAAGFVIVVGNSGLAY